MPPARSFAIATGVLLGIAGAIALTRWVGTRPIDFPPPRPDLASDTLPTHADFLGSEACSDCHAAQYRKWSGSTHGKAGGLPSLNTVIAPFDGTPIQFADAVVIPTITPDGRFRFVVEADAEEPIAIDVAGVVGGGHMVGGGTQGFLARFADGTLRFLPFDFIRQENQWFCNSATRTDEGWIPITPDVSLADCGDWPPIRVFGTDQRFANCQECHGSQIEISFDTATFRYDTRLVSYTINCESCHGPGRRHVEQARNGQLSRESDIGMRSLAGLSKDESLEVCFQCHALKDVLEPGYLPGKPLEQHYSLGLPQLGEQALFPDGRVRTFAYQGNHRYSACYLNGSMTCTDCHDPHSQGYRDVWGNPLPDRFDDGQCTSCHPSKAAQPELHTHHPAESAGVRCVSCHMPYLQQPDVGRQLRYARSDHSIAIPRPAADDRLGVDNACRQCHAEQPVQALQDSVESWFGDLKPAKPIVRGLERIATFPDVLTATRALLRPDAGHPMAQVAAIGLFAQRFLRPDMPLIGPQITSALWRMANSDDLDVRAVALAAIHLARGSDRRTRRRLVRALDRAGSDAAGLRARWVLALGTFGDNYGVAADWPSARAAYLKALELQSNRAGVLRNLGLASLSSGDNVTAATTLRRSLAIDPYQPFSWLNLGVALERLGDGVAAEEAYVRTLEIRPDHALAHFNLGNLLHAQGRSDEATGAYQRAVRYDPSLYQAHLALARSFLEQGDLTGAVAAARKAARQAREDPGVGEVLRRLEAAAGAR